MGRGARIIMMITKTSNVDCEHLKKNVCMDAPRCWRNAVKFRTDIYTCHGFALGVIRIRPSFLSLLLHYRGAPLAGCAAAPSGGAGF